MDIFKKSVICVFVSVSLIACGGGGDTTNNNGSTVQPPIEKPSTDIGNIISVNININTLSNLTLSSLPVVNSVVNPSLVSETSIRTLSVMTADKGIAPVTFKMSSGKNAILTFSDAFHLNKEFIAVAFNAVSEVDIGSGSDTPKIVQELNKSGKALISLFTGKIYDVSAYKISNSIVQNSTLYTTDDNGGLFKIDMNNLSNAIPLNNPKFNPAGPIKFIIDGKLISNGYSFDINAEIPAKAIIPTFESIDHIPLPVSSGVAVHDWNDGYVIDSNKNLWAYRIVSGTKIAIYKLDIDDNGKTLVSNYSEFTVPFNLRGYPGGALDTFNIDNTYKYGNKVIVGGAGYCKIEVNPAGGVKIQAQPLSFTGIDYPASYQFPLLRDMNLFWITSYNNQVMKMDLTNNTLTQVYSDKGLVTSNKPEFLEKKLLQIVDDSLIFYQYTSATSVGTFSLSIKETTPPVKISTNQVNARSIDVLAF